MTENVNRNLPPELSDDDAELLSAYMDNMLTAAERETLEKRLESDAFLRAELQAMRRMVTWLNQMPDLKAPRNFTLSAEDAAKQPPNVVLMPRRNVWLSAAAAAVVIVLFGVVFVLSNVQRENAPSQPLESAGDTARGIPQDEAEQVAGVSSPTAMLTATASTQNQTGLAAPTILGGATMPVMSTFAPTMTIDQQGVDSATTGESDDAAIVTDDVREEAENSTLAMAQANSADGLLTATVVMETGQPEIMAASVVREETAQEAQVVDGLLTATVVMATGETFAFSATETPNVMADTAMQAPAPMTASALPTQALRSSDGAGASQPFGATGSTSALDNLRMTATAFVELYAQDSADSEIAAESVDSDADEKQSVFNVRQFFLYLWIRLLEFIGTAP